MNAPKALDILGIPPTEDGRVVRSAFLRLARIYHPDRYAEAAPDVRAEAERRMKEATSAYGFLLDAIRAEPLPTPAIDDEEMRERARVYHEAVQKKQTLDERDRDRWRKWEAAEQHARAKARREAEIAARLAYEATGGRVPVSRPAASEEDPLAAEVQPDSLGRRLEAAHRGERNPLVPTSAKPQ